MGQRRWVKFALFITGSTLAALFFAVQMHLGHSPDEPALGWGRLITSEMGKWYAWAALLPLIWWLTRRFPLESPRFGRGLLVHITATLAITVIQPSLMAVLVWTVRGFSDPLTLIVSRILVMKVWLFSENLVIYWLVLMACHAIQYQARLRAQVLRGSQLEVQLAQAQLNALKMQVRPHFLFNTLNSISALLHEDLEAADRMVARLGDFLRLTLEHSENQEVTLEKELEFLRCYLDIELTRFQDRLRVKFDIAPGTLGALTPNLILQPLVENAIRHGIAHRVEPGCIEIRSERHGERLRIQVRDDGPGFASNSTASKQTARYRGGIGLANTRARLERLYGSGYVLELSNGTQPGATVTVEIPFHVQENILFETAGPLHG